MLAAVEHVYRYHHPSVVGPGRVSLVTSLDCRVERFFEGRVLQPRRAADLLLGIADVVRSRFYVPAAMLQRVLLQADPVITCHPDRLRFEGFSSCAGVYGRLDLEQSCLDGEVANCGTTNVDFNPEMRAALAAIRSDEQVRLSIGARAIGLETASRAVIEKKVALPLRWLKSFSEVGLHQAQMRLWKEISGAAFRRFLLELPGAATGEFWLGGADLRLSKRNSPGAISVGGIARLRPLLPLSRYADSARVYAGDGAETAWELRMAGARFTLLLSADVWRGFSGEGRALSALAKTASAADVNRLRALLRCQAIVNDGNAAVLARCAASGLLGYDLDAHGWFHRELPFDLERTGRLYARIASARSLVDCVEIDSSSRVHARAWVRSVGADHRVVLAPNPSCTCPWFNKHGLSRGPCKHILAVEMKLEPDERS